MAENIGKSTKALLDEEAYRETEQVCTEIAQKTTEIDDSVPVALRPQTKEELYADLELALEQVKRGEFIPLEQFEAEFAREFGDELQSSIDTAGKHKSA